MSQAAMQFSVERMQRWSGEGSFKAFADVVVNGAVLIKGFRVVNGSKGLFVGMPRQPAKNGKWFDAVKPLTKDAHAALTRAVLEAYADGAEDSHARMAATSAS